VWTWKPRASANGRCPPPVCTRGLPVGKLFVVPAGALPLPVSGALYEGQYNKPVQGLYTGRALDRVCRQIVSGQSSCNTGCHLRWYRLLCTRNCHLGPTPETVLIISDSHRTAIQKLRIATWDFGWEIAHAAVSRRPPISLYTVVARSEGYTYAANVWDLSLVQGRFSVAPRQGL
jgi:hypothetical protein